MNAARFCFSVCFAKSHVCTYFGRTFQETVFHFDLLRGHRQSGFVWANVTAQKEGHLELTLCERDGCVVNKPSISLVSAWKRQTPQRFASVFGSFLTFT